MFSGAAFGAQSDGALCFCLRQRAEALEPKYGAGRTGGALENPRGTCPVPGVFETVGAIKTVDFGKSEKNRKSAKMEMSGAVAA